MLEADRTWTHTFPYRGGEVTVLRLLRGWRLVFGERTSKGATLVDAFEHLLGRPAKDEEMRVVVAALDRDQRVLAESGAPLSADVAKPPFG